MEHIFLYHGGTYHKGADDGRLRKPLTCVEGDLLQHDDELGTENSVGGELHMSRWQDIFNNVSVGDMVYMQVVPDSTGIRGFWAVPSEPLPGFKVCFDFVKVCDIYTALVCDKPYEDVDTVGPTTELVFDKGIGQSPLEAALQADMDCSDYEDIRPRSPGAANYFGTDDQFVALPGESMYVRMTIKALPTAAAGTACTGCGKSINWPKLQAGTIIDKLCISKLEWSDHCRCKAQICAGCDLPECQGCAGKCDDEEELIEE